MFSSFMHWFYALGIFTSCSADDVAASYSNSFIIIRPAYRINKILSICKAYATNNLQNQMSVYAVQQQTAGKSTMESGIAGVHASGRRQLEGEQETHSYNFQNQRFGDRCQFIQMNNPKLKCNGITNYTKRTRYRHVPSITQYLKSLFPCYCIKTRQKLYLGMIYTGL